MSSEQEWAESWIYEGGRLMPGLERAPPGGAEYNPVTHEWRPIRSETEIEQLRSRQKARQPTRRREQPQEKETHRRRYGPGQLISKGIRAGPNGAELDTETGQIHQLEPVEESGVRHLGSGQFRPGGERCGPGGCDVDAKTGELIRELGGKRAEYLEEEQEQRELDELERQGL
ncbi:hypothetical protein P9112_006665 [Eukaryota sp. TZLM1-RC]